MNSLASRALLAASLASIPMFAGPILLPGNLVVSVSGNGVPGAGSGPYTDTQASPLTLFQYQPNGTASASLVNFLTLPQVASGLNLPVSAEYGSSSEGTLHLSGNGQYLTVMGYGVNANDFNSNPGTYGGVPGNTRLAQSGSLTGQGYTPVARVVALIDANGNVNSTTGVFNVFDQNNPRSVYTPDGTSFYISGQGNSPDHTGGVYLTTLGSSSATAITGDDTNTKMSSQDTRDVQIVNGQLYVSVDSKEGSGSNRDFIGTLGAPPATSLFNGGAGPTKLAGFGNSGGTGKVTLTAGQTNGINQTGKEINLSPENFFFADANTLYVADSGLPKNDSVTNDGTGSTLGDGGLQKWSLIGGTWTLDYTLADGLNMVANTASLGTTGLIGLTGVVVNGQVLLYATNATKTDLDPTFLFGITDTLSSKTKPVGESFTTLAAAPADSNFRGVAFAPVPEPTAITLLGLGAAALLLLKRSGSFHR